MAFYALGVCSTARSAEVVGLCRKYSSKSVGEIRKLVGTGKMIVEWNSSVSATAQDKGRVIAAIQEAVRRFESLGLSLSYFYRPTINLEWMPADASQFRNLLRTDLETWNELLSQPD